MIPSFDCPAAEYSGHLIDGLSNLVEQAEQAVICRNCKEPRREHIGDMCRQQPWYLGYPNTLVSRYFEPRP